MPPASASARDGAPAGWRSRGYLPHIDRVNLVQHVVFRLADSLPAGLRNELDGLRTSDHVDAIDAALDRGHGRRDLANPTVAGLVQNALLAFAWCVMPNHVHALVAPLSGYRLDRIVHSWKSYTAKTANRLLQRSGAFWAREYFDRFMRNADHLARTAAYIEGNPVKVGLCESVSDWRFSSAWRNWAKRYPAELWSAGVPPACRPEAGGPGLRD